MRYHLFDNSPLLCPPADIQARARPAPTSSYLFFPRRSSHVLLSFFQEKPELELLLSGQVLLKQNHFIANNWPWPEYCRSKNILRGWQSMMLFDVKTCQKLLACYKKGIMFRRKINSFLNRIELLNGNIKRKSFIRLLLSDQSPGYWICWICNCQLSSITSTSVSLQRECWICRKRLPRLLLWLVSNSSSLNLSFNPWRKIFEL